MMSRSARITRLTRQITPLRVDRNFILTCSYNTNVRHSIPNQSDAKTLGFSRDQFGNQAQSALAKNYIGGERKPQVGENVSRKDKISFLVNTLLDLKDSKEAVYGALDAWVAWERNFPIGPLKQVLLKLEKEQQWHRIVQVIKWMLSKGQGNTMGTYEQLIKALDMDHRAKETHEFWKNKIGYDLHSVPWRLCSLMISVYYRNHMLEDLVKLFKGLEAFDRKPPDKSVVQKVADTYELLGLFDEKDRLLEKYKDLFMERRVGSPKRLRGPRSQREGKLAQEN
ncbi:pentatricopeptide repeat-containing protein At4g18975, chloroplastic [Nicotiana tabacum]|uniref:Pentatricopeptide repeat-containing protein At4g18975, chloroplastic n=1 Tax=Nicotiana tabacum TaxID=4097 RepID=A0A1S3ZGR5_TOBAC|nr:PREDICTED: pentatricopeptide repeat-containing protein At4g18975, chloroplastic-like [Nicotiana tabacum]